MERELLNLLSNSQTFVGTKQVLREMSSGRIRCVILAEDADDFIKDKIILAANQNGVAVHPTSSQEELGKLAGIAVKAAVIGIIKE